MPEGQRYGALAILEQISKITFPPIMTLDQIEPNDVLKIYDSLFEEIAVIHIKNNTTISITRWPYYDKKDGEKLIANALGQLEAITEVGFGLFEIDTYEAEPGIIVKEYLVVELLSPA